MQIFGGMTSTNSVLRGLAVKGAPEGTVVIADEQTAGHGRLGKQWFSPPGVNLYASVLFRTLIPPRVKQRVLPTDIVGGRRGLWRMA